MEKKQQERTSKLETSKMDKKCQEKTCKPKTSSSILPVYKALHQKHAALTEVRKIYVRKQDGRQHLWWRNSEFYTLLFLTL